MGITRAMPRVSWILLSSLQMRISFVMLWNSAPFRTLLIILLSISIVLQVIASGILLIERLTFRKEDYSKCNKYNATIGVLVVCIIVVNILATSFGGPGDECVHPLVPIVPGEIEKGSGFA